MTTPELDTDCAIIGGGLCGLAVAWHLAERGCRFEVFEARDRLGGRIDVEAVSGNALDLGPSWFWPGQTRMERLVERLGLQRFEQFSEGLSLYDAGAGQVHKVSGLASMAGSWRIKGGMRTVISSLTNALDPHRLHIGRGVVGIEKTATGVLVHLSDGTGIHARTVVAALPPRLVAELAFDPVLPAEAKSELRSVPTWMAGQAKAFAVYHTPFWRDLGLSGDAVSRVGPLVEIHDASGADGTPAALFGFVGVPPSQRTDRDALENAIKAQLTRVFGPDAARPDAVILKDWAKEPQTATLLDHAPLNEHPDYRPIQPIPGAFAGRVVLAGSETASEFGGYLEGALVSADAAARQVWNQITRGRAQDPDTMVWKQK